MSLAAIAFHPPRVPRLADSPPFRQKFLEIDRRQGGDVAPPSYFIRHEPTRRDRSPATIFLTTRRDTCDSAMSLLSSDRPDLSFCQIRQKHETAYSAASALRIGTRAALHLQRALTHNLNPAPGEKP
jgi:hypothetical protein